MKTIDASCGTCDKIFQMLTKEHKRHLKNGRGRFFCSMSCAAIKNNEEHPRKGNAEFLIANNRKDEFTPFKYFVNHAKSRNNERSNKRDFNLTIDFVKQLWENQSGICPFTGWELILPPNSNGHISPDPANASLDRIDNAKGYIQGNVRFVSVMANFARNKFADEQLINFCKAVANEMAT